MDQWAASFQELALTYIAVPVTWHPSPFPLSIIAGGEESLSWRVEPSKWTWWGALLMRQVAVQYFIEHIWLVLLS